MINVIQPQVFKLLHSHCGIGVDPVDHRFDSQPQGQVGEHLHHAALVGEGWFLKNGQVFHHTVAHNVLHDLVDKVNLPAVQICVIEVIRKGLFRRSHVQAHDLPDELPQGLGADLRFIVLSGAHLAPEDTLQRSNVLLASAIFSALPVYPNSAGLSTSAVQYVQRKQKNLSENSWVGQ